MAARCSDIRQGFVRWKKHQAGQQVMAPYIPTVRGFSGASVSWGANYLGGEGTFPSQGATVPRHSSSNLQLTPWPEYRIRHDAELANANTPISACGKSGVEAFSSSSTPISVCGKGGGGGLQFQQHTYQCLREEWSGQAAPGQMVGRRWPGPMVS